MTEENTHNDCTESAVRKIWREGGKLFVYDRVFPRTVLMTQVCIMLCTLDHFVFDPYVNKYRGYRLARCYFWFSDAGCGRINLTVQKSWQWRWEAFVGQHPPNAKSTYV